MYKINFSSPCKIHFIGIGGISMSGFAEYLHNNKFTITGSDNSQNKITNNLKELGIQVFLGQRPSNISSDLDLVVYTAAIKEDNPELQRAIDLDIPLLNRAQLIGQIMNQFDNPMAVAGTHGKTTATSMLSMILVEADLDPTISLGGILDAIGGNIKIGHSEHFLTEACEYTNSFLHFNPKRAVILNIDEDHLDFFKDIEDIRNSFKLFAKNLPKDGELYINGEIDNYKEIVEGSNCKVISYGVVDHNNEDTTNLDCDYLAKNLYFDSLIHGSFDLYHKDQFISNFQIPLTGVHNISNAVPAIAMALNMGIDIEVIKSALNKYTGTKRRFEYKGVIGGVTIIDDYAHHPTEIVATLEAAKEQAHNNLWCVFQPHTFTRTKQHLDEFATSLALADKIVLADIFPAREKDPGDISSRDLLDKLRDLGKESYHFSSFDEIESFLLQNCIHHDLLITMGAGDIAQVGDSLLGE